MESPFNIAFNQTQIEQELCPLQITGEIPKWISGSFYRNGPGTFSTSKATLNHWFDGLAMIHRFDIQHGNVQYKSNFLDTNVKDSIINNDSISFPEFATDPCYSIFKKLKMWFDYVNPKVNIQPVNGRLFALGETMMQLEIDKQSLDKIGVHSYSNRKNNLATTTAHPFIENNYLYNVVTRLGMLNYYEIVKYDVLKKKSTSICKISIANPSYLHSMGMSENYFILIHFPYECKTIDFVLKSRPYIENFNWKENKDCVIYIVSKKTGKVVHKLKSDPFFAFHFINAYELDNKLIFDLCVYPNSDIIDAFYLNKLANPTEQLPGSTVQRFTFNFTNESLERKLISDQLLELVTIDDRLITKEYAHLYGLGISKEGSSQFYDQLIKINLQTGKHLIWKDADYYPGEPKFIPKADGDGDDDGIIISILINIKDKSKGTKLLFLDAKTFKEIAYCETPHTIIPGFHSCFLS